MLVLIIRPRIELDMRLTSKPVLLAGLITLCFAGCHGSSALTRIPAPATGAISGNGNYYRNQNSTNTSYTPGGTSRSDSGEAWSPRARGPVENLATNPEGRQISYEEPVDASAPEIIRIPVRSSEQGRVNETFRESGLQPLENPVNLETPPSPSGGAVLKEDGGDNWVSRQ